MKPPLIHVEFLPSLIYQLQSKLPLTKSTGIDILHLNFTRNLHVEILHFSLMKIDVHVTFTSISHLFPLKQDY